MNTTFKHSCGGNIGMVLHDSAFFCMAPRVTPTGVALSLGEIGKYEEEVGLSVVDKTTDFSVAWSCLECKAILTIKEADDIITHCSACSREVSASDAVTTRGYSCLCAKCLKEIKKQKGKMPARTAEPSSDDGLYITSTGTGREPSREPRLRGSWGEGKKTDTYSAKPFTSIMFNDVKLRRNR